MKTNGIEPEDMDLSSDEHGLSETAQLLKRWYDDRDAESLESLVMRHIEWIRRRAHLRLGPKLRRWEDTGDIVQEVVLEFLRYGPTIRIREGNQLRALLARIVENTLRGRVDWYQAQRRRVSRDQALPRDSVLNLDPPRKSAERPSGILAEIEQEGWIRLGMELLEPELRDLIVMRYWEGLRFAEMGRRLDTSTHGARMRLARAVNRLSDKVTLLRWGRLDEALE